MELKSKAWIAREGRVVISRGRAELLEAVDAAGSLSAAARRLGMSYRHAWTLIRTSEERAGFALLHSTKGGAGGGGARLTDEARGLLAKYRVIEADFDRFARKKEEEHGLAET